MANECFEWALGLLKDPRFMEMRKRADDRPLPWDEFMKMAPPSGVSSLQAWDLLTTIRRQTAVELPFLDGSGKRGWHSHTRSMLADLTDIDERCHEGSWLDTAIRSRNATHFLIEMLVDDANTAIREDGIVLGYERAREILLGQRAPENPEEQLLLNCHRAQWSLESLVTRECTPDLIRALHEKISEGVGELAASLPGWEPGVWANVRLSGEESLELISRMVNTGGFAEATHPLLAALTIFYLFTNARPLPAWNGIMTFLVVRLLFMKAKLPVLAFVPILKMDRAWRDGIIRPPAVPTTWKDAMILIGDSEVDFTIQAATLVHLARLELDATETEFRRILARDDALFEMLHCDPDVNYRQRAVLLTALSNPDAIFKIDTHQRIYGVSYGTARTDLLDLSGLGFLLHVRHRRAFVFTPAPGLRQLLRDHRPNNYVMDR
ncbi:MAG: hypothetical protein AB2L09_05275 [Coriobacteriia bacterium]